MSRTNEPRSQGAAHEAAHDDAPIAGEQNVDARIYMIEEGDSEHLAVLLRQHPEQRDALVAIAMKYAGNDTVLKALELVDPKPVAQAPTQAPAPEEGGIDQRIHYLEAGDAKVLAKMIELNPEQREKLIDDATKHAGPQIVQEALAILDRSNPEAAVAPQQAPTSENKDSATEAATATEVTPPQVVEQQVQAEVPAEPRAETPAQTKPEAEQPGWVVRARAFNRAHAADVESFNVATQSVCVDPASGEVDPYKVAQWQADNGVPPDGRVGGRTVDNAILSMKWDLAPQAESPDTAREA